MHHVGRTWVGGRLYVSDRRLLFCPGLLLRRRQGVLRVALAEIGLVEKLEREVSLGALSGGGLKPRVLITTRAGERHAFTMQRFGKLADELLSLLAAGASPHPTSGPTER